jgi:hypothetical protein
VPRRPHPYFGQIKHEAQACPPKSGEGRVQAPEVMPEDEPGVLWQAFREPPPSAVD